MFAYDHNHVAVLVCGCFGFLMWPFGFVAVLDVIRELALADWAYYAVTRFYHD